MDKREFAEKMIHDYCRGIFDDYEPEPFEDWKEVYCDLIECVFSDMALVGLEHFEDEYYSIESRSGEFDGMQVTIRHPFTHIDQWGDTYIIEKVMKVSYGELVHISEKNGS